MMIWNTPIFQEPWTMPPKKDWHTGNTNQTHRRGHQAQHDRGIAKDQADQRHYDERDNHSGIEHQGEAVDQGFVNIEQATGEHDLREGFIPLDFAKKNITMTRPSVHPHSANGGQVKHTTVEDVRNSSPAACAAVLSAR